MSTIFFKQEIPTDAETDYAISYIEHQRATGVFRKTSYRAVSQKRVPADSYSRQSIEDLFSRYARVIMGAPASELNAPITRTDFAILLLLREIMHHFGFETIKLIG